jgi:RNase H-like domain found in reverse transcriptase
MPLERLLSSGHAGEWGPECTQAVNDLTQAMYHQVKLVQGDPSGEFCVYVSVEGSVGLIATTQEKEGKENPVAFLSRYLTKTELKWSQLEQMVSLLSWGLRKLRRYSTYAKKIKVVVPWDESVAVLLDRQHHIRLRALMIELHMYKVEWIVGENRWELGGPLFKSCCAPDVEILEGEIPYMTHQTTKLKKPT